ncbi:hypothetical protein C8R42DRAFT_597525 [Lentinula raphanica]|nr:hypothetical protein C8R42DRAFT_597525 [Lentinula raphanica]
MLRTIHLYLPFANSSILKTLVSTPVQVFMAWRIRKITKRDFPAAFICLLALASLAGSIWLAVSFSNIHQFAEFVHFRGPPTLWLVSSALADIVIAVYLMYGLVGWILSSSRECGRLNVFAQWEPRKERKTIFGTRRWGPARTQPGPAVGLAANDWQIDRVVRGIYYIFNIMNELYGSRTMYYTSQPV